MDAARVRCSLAHVVAGMHTRHTNSSWPVDTHQVIGTETVIALRLATLAGSDP